MYYTVHCLATSKPMQSPYSDNTTDGKYSWDIALCGGLNYSCHQSSQNVSVCQNYDGHQRISGLTASRKLVFFDGSLSMRLDGGDKCNSIGKNRSTLISFECDRTVLAGQPRYVQVCGVTPAST